MIVVTVIIATIIGGFTVKNKEKKEKELETTVSVEKTDVSKPTPAPEKKDVPKSTTAPKTTSKGKKTNKLMVVTANTLNVREKPSADSKVIGVVKKNEKIKVVELGKGWNKVIINNKEGYCSAKYLKDESKHDETTTKKPQEKNSAPYKLFVNKAQNIVVVYGKDDNGKYTKPIKSMICSVGLNNSTPTGEFNTTDKYTLRALFGGVYGQYATRITGHYLFHSVPYYTKNKGNLESEEYNKLGKPASQGCIRLSVADAKWIYDHCPKGTPVKIYSSKDKEPLPRPQAIKIDLKSPHKGWDPTDPDPKNPW